jgi:hypothetical protein
VKQVSRRAAVSCEIECRYGFDFLTFFQLGHSYRLRRKMSEVISLRESMAQAELHAGLAIFRKIGRTGSG